MSRIKRTVLSLTAVLFVLTVLFIVMTALTDNAVYNSFAITFGTVFYHFAMRLAVGKLIPEHFDYESFWFREKSFEKKLYKAIGVKKWKGRMPSYTPSSYMIKTSDFTKIIYTMCRNEVIHEVIAVLSFVPILFSFVFDETLVFLITSVLACLFDLAFVVMQRYNRPRLIRLMNRYSKRK